MPNKRPLDHCTVHFRCLVIGCSGLAHAWGVRAPRDPDRPFRGMVAADPTGW